MAAPEAATAATHLPEGHDRSERALYSIIATNFKSSLKANFLVSSVVSGVSNVMDLIQGKSTPMQAAVTFGADTLAYTGIGATASALGAACIVLIPIPFIGTAIGLAAGMGLGFLYEKMVRPPVKAMIQ